MNIGDVVAMNGCKIEFGTKTEGGAVTYRAPKGERFVFLLLGSTPIDGSAPLDPDDVLKELGWSPTSPEMGEISREELDEADIPSLFERAERGERLTSAEQAACAGYELGWRDGRKDSAAPLVAALDPFADACESCDEGTVDDHTAAWESPLAMGVTYGDFRRAAATLSKLKENGLSREGFGGLARSQPGSDAQERSPVPPLSDGGRV